ncbi:metallophosphoesterase [Pendulispora rubella]|uniref:Metallophosphoesterase n=1 Tax=Pendulispora rubella TaxID=2741070 RepID=A0ABZ2KT99_9BACT
MPTLTLGIVTDLHFGPEAHFRGKLRKLTHHAAALTEAFVDRMNREIQPDLIVNLGDDIEDESREADRVRYAECQSILRKAQAPLLNVAGNHDLVNLTRGDLVETWRHEGPLYYALDHGGWHLVVLHTIERTDQDIRIPKAQLDWLRDDLQRASLPTIVFMHHSASEQDLDDSRWFSGRPELALVAERAELRSIFEESRKVRAIFNGHLHRNHFDVIRGIPYVTIQSLIENLDDDAPGRPSASHAVVRLTEERIVVRVHGNDPARYQIEL